jgi:hypothetical protein
MATVQDVKINIDQASPDSAVHVTATVLFEPFEVGKEFKMRIELFGKEIPNDDEPGTNFSLNPKPLATFSFGQAPFIRSYKQITATASEMPINETQPVTTTKLNEDPKHTKLVFGFPPQQILMAHDDEIVARVTVAQEASAVSADYAEITV